jgi:hypothetical protein
MRISDFRVRRDPGGARASARVAWEDAPRPEFELFFETDAPGADDLEAAPEAFAVACVHPAVRAGERRLRIEGTLCPRLAGGLEAAVALLGSWYGPPRREIAVETAGGPRALTPRAAPRAALFLTGGADSLDLLRENRAVLPAGHPASFRDAISVYGHLCAETDASPWYARARPELEATARAAGAGLVSVRTNLWRLFPDFELVCRESLSASLACAAHLFRRRWTSVSLASGRDVTAEIPRGTHPLLDPLYSSSAVEIRHDASPRTRFERLRALGAARPGLESLLVCQTFPQGPHLNCGACEKCVRTMTELVALGSLSRARHFPPGGVSPERIRAVPVGAPEVAYWEEVLPELAARGRDDLVAAIRAKLAESRRLIRWARDEGWRGRLRRLDRRLFGGQLLALSRRLRGRRRA